MAESQNESIQTRTLERLCRAMGKEQAEALWNLCMARAGVKSLETPAELLAFGDQLTAAGGFAAVLGQSMRTHALLRGAKRT